MTNSMTLHFLCCPDFRRCLSFSGLVLLSAFVLSGCIRIDRRLAINESGGGIFQITFAARARNFESWENGRNLSKEVDALNIELGEIEEGETPPSVFEVESLVASIEESENSSLEVQNAYDFVENGWRYTRVVVSFKEVSALCDMLFFANRSVRFWHDKSGRSHLEITTAGDGYAAIVGSGSFLDPFLSSAKSIFEVRVPGKIFESNGRIAGDMEMVIRYDWGEAPRHLGEFFSPYVHVVFESDGGTLSQQECEGKPNLQGFYGKSGQGKAGKGAREKGPGSNGAKLRTPAGKSVG